MSMLIRLIASLAVAAATFAIPTSHALPFAEGVAEAPAGVAQSPTRPSGATPATMQVTHKPSKVQAQQRAKKHAQKRAQKRAKVPVATANPLAGRPWGVYKGAAEMAWPPYDRATGERKVLLGKIALTPKATWFGSWTPDNQIQAKVAAYIANSQAGDPTALVQMAVFRMEPWEHDACTRLSTKAEAASYKQWTNNFAAAIGTTPTAIILQPDGPFALCAPRGSKKHSRLIAYSARVFSALPNTSVYIDAGAADWPSAGQGGVPRTLEFLIPSGIKYARGFALNSTHYSSTVNEVQRGAEISRALAARGIGGKTFVVNTSMNGQPFEFGKYTGPDDNHPWVCRRPADTRTCVALGLPPTADVSNPAWGLPASTRQLAAQYTDGYMWFGRPWLYRQNQPFLMGRALKLAAQYDW